MAAVRIIVANVERSIAFFRACRFELVEQYGPAMAILERNDLQLWLAGPASSAAKPWADGTKPAPGGFTRLVLPMSIWEEQQAAIEAAGGQILNGPLSGPGGTQLIVGDADGNQVEFFD